MRLPVIAAATLVMRIIVAIRAIFKNDQNGDCARDINPPPKGLIWAHFTSRVQHKALMTSDIDLHQRPVPPCPGLRRCRLGSAAKSLSQAWISQRAARRDNFRLGLWSVCIFLNHLSARLCPFWRGFEFISSAGPEDSLLFDDAEGVVERKNGAPEGTR
jgi:hypothetical protein